MGISIGFPGRTPSQKRRIHVVSHTHWDREWYLPFEEFRARLVHTVDDLLDILARDPRYEHFTLDGQTIVLEDYLDARPDRREEITEHVAAGRLLIGPWYVMPDEFLVSPEALVRNLLRGLRAAAEFGPAMRVGYVPDSFGHVSQLPQIFRGFGIESAVLWRGVDGAVPRSEFLWRAPDGSAVLTHHLRQGYSNGEDLPTDPNDFLERLTELRRLLEREAADGCLLLMNGGDHAAPQPELPDLIAAANRRLRDAELVHSTLPDFVAAVHDAARSRGVRWDVVEGELRSSAHAHILAGVLSTRLWIKQRNAAAEHLLEKWAEPFAVFSGQGERSKPLLRLAWRHLLRNQPHDSICGCSVDQVHDEMRVRFDRAEQLASRVADGGLRAITGRIDTSAIASSSGHDSRPRGAGYLAVFNPTSGPRADFVQATIAPLGSSPSFVLADAAGEIVPYQVLARKASDVLSVTAPKGQVETYLRLAGNGERWRLAIMEKAVAALARGTLPRLGVAGFRIRSGRKAGLLEVDVQAVEGGGHDYEAVGRCVRELRAALADDVQTVRFQVIRQECVEVGFVARDLPDHGYAVFQVLSSAASPLDATDEGPAETGGPGSGQIENEYFSVKADPADGTLVVLDKEAGAVYSGLNAFVDSGDCGDEYTYCPPARDSVVAGPSAPPTIAVVEDGSARRTLGVEQTYLLPEALDAEREARSERLVPCRIASRISLYPGVRRIDVETVVENAAADHLLRVKLPSGAQTDRSHAAGHFAVEARAIDQPPAPDGWPEQPAGTIPHDGFVDVSDGRRGLLIAAKGLPEAAVRREASGATVYLTLLRSVGWLSRDDLATRQGPAGPMLPTPDAQCLGRHVYHYSILPHSGGWEDASREARAFLSPLRAVGVEPTARDLPPALSFLSARPNDLVVSAVKPPEEGEGLIVRVYNPTRRDLQARLELWRPLARATLVNLNEEDLEDLPVDGRVARAWVRSGQVVTLRLRLA